MGEEAEEGDGEREREEEGSGKKQGRRGERRRVERNAVGGGKQGEKER